MRYLVNQKYMLVFFYVYRVDSQELCPAGAANMYIILYSNITVNKLKYRTTTNTFFLTLKGCKKRYRERRMGKH